MVCVAYSAEQIPTQPWSFAARMSLYSRSTLLLSRNQLRFRGICLHRCHSTNLEGPLRILFCGSDDFSIASLKALHAEHIRQPDIIESIEVVCRPGKRAGRGLKQIREVPIKDTATKLGLRIHEVDTFTGWTPPTHPIDLIVAVSFGLLVPPRLLKAAKYGGVNVHPSLLPDFRGPAPLHHTLLAGRTRTGVTLQTLHPEHFDHGIILDQTPAPGFKIPNPESCTVPELLNIVSAKSAQMLVNGIRRRIFVPPVKDVGWCTSEEDDDLIHATKITPENRHIDWSRWTWTDISRRQRVLGRLWNTALVAIKTTNGDVAFEEKRVILNKVEEAEPVPGSDQLALLPGLPFIKGSVPPQPREDRPLYVYASDGKLLRIREAQVAGERVNDGFRAAFKARMLSDRMIRSGDAEFSTFYNPLV